MNIILLSGGSGKRLWPLSNDVRSKQFIKMFKNPDDVLESMVQRVHRQILDVCPDAVVTVATSKTQVSSIKNQLSDNVGISVEPCRKDTFPAIALAAAYLHDVQKVTLESSVIVCPVDPYVDEDFFIALEQLSKISDSGKSNINLLGMSPTYPSEKYGYIIPQDKNNVSKVLEFKEKPNLETAKQYIEKGALWNGGVFGFKLNYILNKAHELIDFKDYNDLFYKYETLNRISFDYAVVEKERDISVLRFDGRWKDLGTWNTFSEAMGQNFIGNVIETQNNNNVHVVNELDIPILCMGLNDVVVSAGVDGILISDKHQSSYIKPFVDNIDRQIMYAEKSWGEFKILDIGEQSLTIRVLLNPNNKMNYHSHKHRDEIWTITKGEGYTVVDGMKQNVRPGDVITIEAGCKHTVVATTTMEIVEVQLGREISVDDKQKFDLEL